MNSNTHQSKSMFISCSDIYDFFYIKSQRRVQAKELRRIKILTFFAISNVYSIPNVYYHYILYHLILTDW